MDLWGTPGFPFTAPVKYSFKSHIRLWTVTQAPEHIRLLYYAGTLMHYQWMKVTIPKAHIPINLFRFPKISSVLF